MLSSLRSLALVLAVVPLHAATPLSTFATGIVQIERFSAPGKQALIFIPALACGPWKWNGPIAACLPPG